MKTPNRSLVALALAAALGAGPLLTVAHAAEPAKAPEATAGTTAEAGAATQGVEGPTKEPTMQAATEQAHERPVVRTVDEAGLAMQEIHGARLALFDGATGHAEKLVKDAAKRLEEAQAGLGEHAMMPTKKGDATQTYVPFHTSFSLAEGFVPQELHKGALEQANRQLAEGDQKGAAESLRVANIDLWVSAAMIPAKSSLEHVQEAEKLIGEKKFHEANLALKAVEESVIVEAYSAHAVPVQGTGGGATHSGAPSTQEQSKS